jgi:GNAT superfamily N-acetyltransferase
MRRDISGRTVRVSAEQKSFQRSKAYVRWSESLPFITGVVQFRDVPIARVHLMVEGTRATLQDIVVDDAAPVVRWLPWWTGRLRQRDFTRHGIGTRLLHAALERARSAGATTIDGLITDHSSWLIEWYQRHGFTFDAETSTISRSLVDAS